MSLSHTEMLLLVFHLFHPIILIRRANVQNTFKIERKGLLNFKIDDGNSPNDSYGNF